MRSINSTSTGMQMITIHAPCVNLLTAMMMQVAAVTSVPKPLMNALCLQLPSRRVIQRLNMPPWESVKDRNTPTAYSGDQQMRFSAEKHDQGRPLRGTAA